MSKIELLVLGSASPRRKNILQALGYTFTVEPVDAEEVCYADDPVGTVIANARAKFEVCRRLYPLATIITADTIVWFKGQLIGKPHDMEEAAAFLHAFSGNIQTVFTGVALGTPESPPVTRVEASSLKFKTLSTVAITGYLQRIKPLDRAGAYDIDESGNLLIASYSGSYTNIMGLPVACVNEWLRLNFPLPLSQENERFLP